MSSFSPLSDSSHSTIRPSRTTQASRWFHTAPVTQIQLLDLARVDDTTLLDLAIEVEAKSYFDFIDAAQAKAQGQGRVSSAHNVFEKDPASGRQRTRKEQLSIARSTLAKTLEGCERVSREHLARLVSQPSPKSRGLLLAGHVEYDPIRGFVLQTADVAVTQRTRSTLPTAMVEVMRGVGVDPSPDELVCLMMIIREDTPGRLALAGGMVPNAHVARATGSADLLLLSDPIAATFRNEVREEMGVDIPVAIDPRVGGRLGIDAAVRTSQLFAGGPAGGTRSDTTLGVLYDTSKQTPHAQVGEDAFAAGSVPVKDLLSYINSGGLLYGDKVDKNGHITRGKHVTEVLIALNKLEHTLSSALRSAPPGALSKSQQTEVQDMQAALDELFMTRSARHELAQLPSVRAAIEASQATKAQFLKSLQSNERCRDDSLEGKMGSEVVFDLLPTIGE